MNKYPLQYNSRVEFYNRSTLESDMDPYLTDSLHTGEVNILKYDGHIIAGTFWFEAVNSKGKVVKITEGRFDIKWQHR
jgi:hypothetical protein